MFNNSYKIIARVVVEHFPQLLVNIEGVVGYNTTTPRQFVFSSLKSGGPIIIKFNY